MILFTLIIALVGCVIADDVPACTNGSVQFNPPADTSEYIWFPKNFSGSQPPQFPDNYNCIYQINVPTGWSASVVLTVNMTVPMDGAVSVQVVDSFQNSEAVYSADDEHFFFVASGGKIHLSTRQSNVKFGFLVRWFKYPDFNPYLSRVSASDTQPLVMWPGNIPIQVDSDDRVSLVVTPPNDDNSLQYLRGVLIYDGPDWNRTCLGTALQVLKSKRALRSAGNFMTVQQLAPYWGTGRTRLIFQEEQNTDEIGEFQGVGCPFPLNCGGFSMDASKYPAAVMTVLNDAALGAEYITAISGTGVLDVYIGGKTLSKSNLIATYQVNNSVSRLPQEFLGYVRTYVLTGGKATVYTTRSGQDFQKNTANAARTGFVASRYYKSGTPSPYQKTYDFFNTGATLPKNNYAFTIQEADFVGNTTLDVSVMNGGKQVYKATFNSTNLPKLKTQVQAVGDDFTVSYDTYGYFTKGFYLDFEFTKCSTRYGLIASLIVALFAMAQ